MKKVLYILPVALVLAGLVLMFLQASETEENGPINYGNSYDFEAEILECRPVNGETRLEFELMNEGNAPITNSSLIKIDLKGEEGDAKRTIPWTERIEPNSSKKGSAVLEGEVEGMTEATFTLNQVNKSYEAICQRSFR